MTRPAIALSIAGSDPSGGAGIQADLKTFSALGVYGAAAITALTAQNTRAVTAVQAIPPSFVRAQIEAVLSDLPVDAIKLGMLESAAVIHAVADALQAVPQIPVVLDPVMLSKSGAPLLAPEAVEALRRRLLPRASVLTPNLPEAAALLGLSETAALGADPTTSPGPAADPALVALCRRLRDLGAQAVVLKGGHIDPQGPRSDDFFWDGTFPMRLVAPRIATRNTHGTGCTYAAAITAGLAQGESVRSAVVSARQYVQQAIVAGAALRIGDGHGPLHHFAALWPPSVHRGS